MIAEHPVDRRQRAGAPNPVRRALWPGRTWRPTLHALTGLPIGLGTGAVLFVVFLAWSAAIWSLLDGPTGGWVLAVLYVLTAVASPVPLLWCVRGLGTMQRARFRAVLGVEILPPPGVVGSWWSWPVRGWRASSSWRQLGYHLLALMIGIGGGALVAVSWSGAPNPLGYIAGAWGDAPGLSAGAAISAMAAAGLLAAPWLGRGVSRVDVWVGRALLGPSPAEELTRRAAELTRRVESLSRSRVEIAAAADAERRRIERDLHDGAQQRLVSLAMNLGLARATLTDVPEAARLVIEQAHDEAIQALAELREFVRGLHPAVLNDRGLDAALSGVVARAPLPVRLRVEVATRCSPSIEAIAYFVVSEALTNVTKHADAGHAAVTVQRAGDRLRIDVTDDGRGGAAVHTEEDGLSSGSGLRGLAQRAAAVDGTLTVHSPPGGPTTITVELPCE